MHLPESPPGHTPFYLDKHAQKCSGVPKHQRSFEPKKLMALPCALGISHFQCFPLWCRIDGLANRTPGPWAGEEDAQG